MKSSVPFTAALMLLVLCLFQAAVRADDVPEFELTPVGSCMYSQVGASALRGDYAYTVTPHGLLVIDISDPGNPTPISETFIRGRIFSPNGEMRPYIALRNDIAYIAGWKTLTAVDISNPRAPYIVGTYIYSGNLKILSEDMELSGDRLYIINDSGLTIFDISNPGNMAVIGQYSRHGVNGLAIKDSLVFLVTTNDGLIVTNVSDPAAISEVAQYDLDGLAVDIDDTLAFVLGDYLVTLDVTDPLNATEISRFRPDSGWYASIRMLFIGNGLACVAPLGRGIFVIDVSAPESPVLSTFIDDYSITTDIKFRDSLAFLSSYIWGLTVLDMTDPAGPAAVGEYDPPYFGEDLVIDGDYAYGTMAHEFRAVDISRPSVPVMAGSCRLNVYAANMAIHDTLVFINGDLGLDVVNVSNPEMPVLVDSIVYPDTCFWGSITADENYVYWAGLGFHILDMSDPSPVSVIGYLPLDCPTSHIALHNGIAYLLLFDLTEIDVSDPSAPEIVEYSPSYDHSDWWNAMSVVIRWPYLYALSDPYGPHLYVFNIEDLHNPIRVSTMSNLMANDMRIVGDSAYILGADSMKVFDLTDPGAPQLVAASDFGGLTLEIIGNTFYSGSREGFFIATTSGTACGDINGDGPIDTGDIIWLINYIFRSGPAPIQTGDINASGDVNVADAVYLINYLFGAGPRPICL